MSDKITVTMLRHFAMRVAAMPAVANKVAAGLHLALTESYGRARFRVCLRDDATGGERPLWGCEGLLTASECWAYLHGMAAMAEAWGA